MDDSNVRKRKLEYALRKHHGDQRREVLIGKISEYGGDPSSLTWLGPEETDDVLNSYVAKYGAPIEDRIVLRIPANVEMHLHWADLRSARLESTAFKDANDVQDMYVLFNERWYLGAAKVKLGQVVVNLIPFALADGEVVAVYSADMASGLIVDVIVGDDGSIGGEMFAWGAEFIGSLGHHSGS